MLQIYYGYGRGKTSAINGLAVRAKGAGLRVGIFRFLKGIKTAEDKPLQELGIEVKKFHYGEKFVIQMVAEEKLKARNIIKQGLDYIRLNKDNFDVICLDEILDLMDDTVAFFTADQILDFLESIKEKEILITGHKKYSKIFRKADLITFYKSEKHYFDNETKHRSGFEF